MLTAKNLDWKNGSARIAPDLIMRVRRTSNQDTYRIAVMRLQTGLPPEELYGRYLKSPCIEAARRAAFAVTSRWVTKQSKRPENIPKYVWADICDLFLPNGHVSDARKSERKTLS